MRAILKCKNCGCLWSCRAIREPDGAIVVDEGDPASTSCPRCESEDVQHRYSETIHD
jgi:hypothetical protein